MYINGGIQLVFRTNQELYLGAIGLLVLSSVFYYLLVGYIYNQNSDQVYHGLKIMNLV